MSPFMFGSKGQGHKSQKQWQHGSLHSCDCWLLLVITFIFIYS